MAYGNEMAVYMFLIGSKIYTASFSPTWLACCQQRL
jgi:hypothetical protein